MKFRRIISVVLILCMAVSLASCKSAGDSKKVVDEFMSALASYDVNEMAKYVEDMPSNADSVYIYDVFTDGHYVDLYQIAYEDTLSYEVVSAKGNSVKIKVTMPDIYSLYQDTFMSFLTSAFSSQEILDYVMDDESEPQLMIIALMIDAIENGDIETVEEEFTLKIGTINGETKIMTNDQLEQLMTSKLSLTQKAVAAEAEDAE